MNRNCFIVFICLCIGLCICSCKNGEEGTNQNTQEQKIVYNDKIQNVFFGVPLGATKEEVIEGFAKHDFYPESYSTDSRLIFYKKSSKSYSFGDMNWRKIYINLSNNRF